MQFLASTVGRKIVMALTGLFMLVFLLVHMLGNLSVYYGPDGMNAYAAKLQGLGVFLWVFRVIMLAVMSLHVFFGIVLTFENHEAKPQSYAMKKNLRANFASKTMIWTGTGIAAYLVYHLLNFTITVIHPEFSASLNPDEMGRPDVYGMVVLNFQHFMVALVYIGGLLALSVHLIHGIQSLFQTLGLNNEKSMALVTRAGFLAALIISLSLISIPITIIVGMTRN